MDTKMNSNDKRNKRFIIFPIQYESIYQLYKTQKRAYWDADEIDFKQDREHFETFKEEEREMIKHIMAFFAIGDAIVNEMILLRLMVETPFEESRLFYGQQMGMEMIHTEAYGLQIEATIRDPEERKKLFHAILDMEGVKRMSQWFIDRMDDRSKSFAECLVAAVVVEGIFFQGAFAIIFWIKERYKGKMPGVIFANDLISADERLHADHSVQQYHLLDKKLDTKQVHEIFQSAMDMERFFVNQFMTDGVLGLSKKHLLEHLEYICDFWISELGHEKLFGTKNPLEYMDKIGMA